MKQQVKLNGTHDGPPVTRTLHSGALRMIYERGNLRGISAGRHEIIRMIYFAVRDKDWITVIPEISGEKIVEKDTGFEIGYNAVYRHEGMEFEADVAIVSRQANQVVLEMKGLARSAFTKNRIGFCILHPIAGCAGHKVAITHPDGTSSPGEFPEDISPHQPFKDIRSMQWNVNDSLTGHLRFDGDIFETEDQRNWTDDSYKTYSTPLDQPYPVELAKGTVIYQRVELLLEGEIPGFEKEDSTVIFHAGNQAAGKLPDVGVCGSSRSYPITVAETGILKRIFFSHIRRELILCGRDPETQYASVAGEVDMTGLPSELCLFFGEDPEAELGKFLDLFRTRPFPVKRFIIFSAHSKVTENSLFATVVPLIRRAFPGIPAGGGTNRNFAQVNRQQPVFEDIDFVTFAIHPQEHASDERTMAENTAAQADAVRSALNFSIRKPVIVSPVTLQRRFNANSDNYEVHGQEHEMPPAVDARQMSLFGAAWTVGSLKYLLESGIRSVTYYETVGERGLFMGEYGSRWPGRFMAGQGMIFPVYHLFRMLLSKPDPEVIQCKSTDPLVVNGFAVTDKTTGLVFISNMTWRKQKFLLQGIEEYRIILRMNTDTFEALSLNSGLMEQNQLQKGNQSGFTLSPFETLILEYQI